MSVTATVAVSISILPFRLCLKLVLECGERGGTTDALKLALDVVIDMLICFSVCASAAASCSASIVIVVHGREGAWGGVAGDRGVEVTAVADGAGGRGASDGGTSGHRRAAGAREDVVEVVGGGGEWGAGSLRETTVETRTC